LLGETMSEPLAVRIIVADCTKLAAIVMPLDDPPRRPSSAPAAGAALSFCLAEPAIFVALIWWRGHPFFD
jgi:hypothetical protein